MEDSFKVRVERIFGSKLFESVPRSSFSDSSWAVTDGDVEKREWNRERGVDPTRGDTPCASAYDDRGGEGCLSKKGRRKVERNQRRRTILGDDDDDDDDDDLDESGDDDEEKDVGSSAGRGFDDKAEERDIRASIGLDKTLDHEEEEDEYDREAICKEKHGDDRVYMSDVTDHGPYMNFHSVVTDFPCNLTEDFQQYDKDHRADHFAANIRLKEDETTRDDHSTVNSDSTAMTSTTETKVLANDVNLKPILKRKEKQLDSRPKKHVRFDSVTVHSEDSMESGSSVQIIKEITAMSGDSTSAEDSPGLPDYIRNPSKYVCYSFDASDDVDDQSNQQAFEDFRRLVKGAQSAELEAGSMELPKSVTFTHRKRAEVAMSTDSSLGTFKEDACKGFMSDTGRLPSIAAGEPEESEVCAMDEDDVGQSVEESYASHKVTRKYRKKSSSRDDDDQSVS